MRPARARILAAGCVALAMLACSQGRVAPAGTPPDVVLIVMDTVRADRLGLYGYQRETSPKLEELARESRTFDRARSTSTWTPPAHASLFTGLFPGAHQTTQKSWTLPDSLSTLAEVLAERGYATAGVVGNPMLTPARGFAQGFERYHETYAGRPARTDLRSLHEIERLLDDLPSPYFLFVNLIGPHGPYDSCGPECGRWASEARVPPFASEWPDFYRGLVEYDAQQLTRFADLYDEELRRVDTIVGRIVAKVRGQGRIDETLLVVTSDHGENLGDHGHIDHVFSLYDSTVKIPLLIRYPPRFLAGTRSQALVQLPDLFPTILAAAGVPEQEIGGQGVDLAQEEQLEGRPQIIEYYRPLQALGRLYERSTTEQQRRLDRYDRKLEAIVTSRYKLVRGSDGETELFDHHADPEELVDLAPRPQAASERRALEDELDEWLERYVDENREAGEHLELPEETRRALEAIGYLE